MWKIEKFGPLYICCALPKRDTKICQPRGRETRQRQKRQKLETREN